MKIFQKLKNWIKSLIPREEPEPKTISAKNIRIDFIDSTKITSIVKKPRKPRAPKKVVNTTSDAAITTEEVAIKTSKKRARKPKSAQT